MRTLKTISGKECIKLLCNEFGFKAVRQKESHVVLRKETPSGAIGTVVPLHSEIKLPTLKNVLKLAHVDERDFVEKQ